jgi:hypothetical protein
MEMYVSVQKSLENSFGDVEVAVTSMFVGASSRDSKWYK